jgi:hypothetical protein
VQKRKTAAAGSDSDEAAADSEDDFEQPAAKRGGGKKAAASGGSKPAAAASGGSKYGPKVEKLRRMCRAAGITVGPSVYVKVGASAVSAGSSCSTCQQRLNICWVDLQQLRWHCSARNALGQRPVGHKCSTSDSSQSCAQAAQCALHTPFA